MKTLPPRSSLDGVDMHVGLSNRLAFIFEFETVAQRRISLFKLLQIK